MRTPPRGPAGTPLLDSVLLRRVMKANADHLEARFGEPAGRRDRSPCEGRSVKAGRLITTPARTPPRPHRPARIAPGPRQGGSYRDVRRKVGGPSFGLLRPHPNRLNGQIGCAACGKTGACEEPHRRSVPQTSGAELYAFLSGLTGGPLHEGVSLDGSRAAPRCCRSSCTPALPYGLALGRQCCAETRRALGGSTGFRRYVSMVL